MIDTSSFERNVFVTEYDTVSVTNHVQKIDFIDQNGKVVKNYKYKTRKPKKEIINE